MGEGGPGGQDRRYSGTREHREVQGSREPYRPNLFSPGGTWDAWPEKGKGTSKDVSLAGHVDAPLKTRNTPQLRSRWVQEGGQKFPTGQQQTLSVEQRCAFRCVFRPLELCSLASGAIIRSFPHTSASPLVRSALNTASGCRSEGLPAFPM